jgi:hypothetical protein
MVVDMSNGAAYNLSPENIEMDMGTGLVREFDSNEPVRTVEAPPPQPDGMARMRSRTASGSAPQRHGSPTTPSPRVTASIVDPCT